MQHTVKPRVTRESTEGVVKIIDSKYEKSNLKNSSQSAHQLYAKEKIMLLHLLKYFEDLFDGILGKWNK